MTDDNCAAANQKHGPYTGKCLPVFWAFLAYLYQQLA